MALPITWDRFRDRRSFRLRELAGNTRSLAVRVVSPHRAALQRLADIPLTVLGTAGIDFAAFHLAHGWGWLVTGISLILIEHVIADET